MPRGYSFEQIGITEAMIATYADAVWELSNNIQIRRGDPIRKLDFTDFETQRPDLGMSDAQIAAVLGLTRDQVLAIRVVTEVRRFRRRNYHRLYELGRGNRFRADRYVAPAERAGFREDALALRAAVRFDPARVAEFVRAGWWGSDTLARWLTSRATEAGARTALSAPEGDLTYAELAAQVERFAAGLDALGLGRGDVVCVQMPNIPEFVVAYLAIARLGAVMSTAHMPYRAAELRTLLAHSRARALICLSATKEYAPAVAALAMKSGLPALDHVIALGDRVEGAIPFVRLAGIEGAPPDDLVSAPVPADPFLLLYTSGTSASPKAVPLTYQAMLGNARAGVQEHRIKADDIVLSAPPYTHLFGLYSFHLALAAGATNLLLPVFTPPDLAQAIAKERPTVLFTGPAHLAALQKSGLLDGTDLSSIRLVICSGSACPPELARAVAAKLPNGRFTQLWGMTETQAGLYTRPDDPLEISATTAGRPSPGTEVRVVGPDGAPLAPGEEGEFQVRGSLMFPGYFDNADANAAAFTADGWFRTGDLAILDAAGNVRITGRSKDVINRGGVKYNPRDIEDLLDAHPGVMQSAIVPMPDPVVGEKACCFIVPRPGSAPALDELCAYLQERGVAKYKLPERLETVAEMPLTPTRKIIKGRLAELLAKGN
ncbi:MAG: AMP-binding protein [Betaproteobacteria bacterium]|nr:AMP-binding protein [Betaproteobacteria bacterium]